MTFSQDIERFMRKVNARADAVVRKIILDVGTSLVFKSPVGNPDLWQSKAPAGYVGGRFRANWQYGEQMPAGTVNEFDGSGAHTVGKIAASIGLQASGKMHYLVNRLPYGPALERGHSTQAPFGMVGLTVLEFQPIVARVVKELAT